MGGTFENLDKEIDKLGCIDCPSCKKAFYYEQSETFWDDHYSNCSAKLIKCPECGKVIVVRYEMQDKEY